MLVGLNQGVRFYIQSQSHLFSGQVHILVRVEMMVDHIDDGGDGRPVWWGVSLNKAEYIYIYMAVSIELLFTFSDTYQETPTCSLLKQPHHASYATTTVPRTEPRLLDKPPSINFLCA